MNNQRKLLALKVQGNGRLDWEGCAIHECRNWGKEVSRKYRSSIKIPGEAFAWYL